MRLRSGGSQITLSFAVAAISICSHALGAETKRSSSGVADAGIAAETPFVDDGSIQDPMPPQEIPPAIEQKEPEKPAKRVSRLRRASVAENSENPLPRPKEVAEAPPWRRTTISFNPAALLFGVVSGELEYATTTSNSLFVSPGLLFGVIQTSGGPIGVAGFGADVGGRLFVNPTAPQGLWFGLGAGAAAVSASTGGSSTSIGVLSATGQVGYNFMLDAFYLSLGAGGSYSIIASDFYAGTWLTPSLRLAVGFAP